MAIQEFALDAMAAHRVQVQWISANDPVTILLNGSPLGSFATQEERIAGKDFMLPDATFVHVRFVNDMPQAFRNGFPLAIASALVPVKTRPGRLTTYLVIYLIITSVYAVVDLLAFLGSLASGDSAMVPLLYLGLALVSGAGIAGIVGLFLWRKWGFYLMVFYFIARFALTLLLGVVDHNPGSGYFFSLVLPVLLYFRLRRHDVWDKLA